MTDHNNLCVADLYMFIVMQKLPNCMSWSLLWHLKLTVNRTCSIRHSRFLAALDSTSYTVKLNSHKCLHDSADCKSALLG